MSSLVTCKNCNHTFDDNEEDFVYQHGRSNKFTAHCPACSTIFFANDICEESAEKAFKKWIHLNESMTEDDVRNLKIDVGMYQVLLYIENNLIKLLDNESYSSIINKSKQIFFIKRRCCY